MKRTMNDWKQTADDEQRLATALKREPLPAVPAERIAAACRAAAAVRGGAVYQADSAAHLTDPVAHLTYSAARPLDPTACLTDPPIHPTHQPARTHSLCAAAFSCLTAGCAFFWIVLAFLLGGCVVAFRLFAVRCVPPLALLTTLSPVPVLSFWIRELYCRDEALAQLERTCRFNPEKLCFARLWGGMACNILFTTLAGALAFPDAANLTQPYLCAFIALFFVGGLALFLICFLREALPLSLLLAAWVLAASYLLAQQELLDSVMCAGTETLAAMLAAGIGVFAVASVCLSKKSYAE